MREFKFRVWHKRRKKFYKVLHLHLETTMNEGPWATCEGFDIIEQKEIHIQVQPEDCILEQYTGLKDKTGKDIYEGDVVKTQNKYISKIVYGHSFDERGDLRSSLSFMRVGLNEEVFKFKGQGTQVYDCGTSLFYDLMSLEVIGNIHKKTEPLSTDL